MTPLTRHDREALLKVARSAISAELNGKGEVFRPSTVSSALQEKSGCFVTLHKSGELRGCIGTIEATRPLLVNVEENALNAAFRDPRFPPLAKDELPAVIVEISVLSVPHTLSFKDPDDLLSKLEPNVHGVIISKDWHTATFLPQVWKQLPRKIPFLEHLCLKAGMGADCWKAPDLVVKLYKVVHFSE